MGGVLKIHVKDISLAYNQKYDMIPKTEIWKQNFRQRYQFCFFSVIPHNKCHQTLAQYSMIFCVPMSLG